jgi:hypothetical protein
VKRASLYNSGVIIVVLHRLAYLTVRVERGKSVEGIVNLIISPDEFSPPRRFLGLFSDDSSRKEAKTCSLFPTFRIK